MDYHRLLEYCDTERQRETIESIILHGGIRQASRALGISRQGVQEVLGRIKRRAALKGYAPEQDLTYPLPAGQIVRGVSTLIDKTNNTSRLQWVKTRTTDDQIVEMHRAIVAELKQDLPKYAPTSAPKHGTNSHLMTQYTLTDCHVGALAWKPETGADWDLEIAERTLAGAFGALIEQSPAAEHGLVAVIGDYMHFDGLAAITPTNGHLLDSDGRFPKVVRAAIRILRAIIQAALNKHQRVTLAIIEGNHDMASTVWLRELLMAVYENEPRLHIVDTVKPYAFVKHGQTLVGFHHGHLKKNDQLPLLFASLFPREWGATTKRYVHTGHRHHTEEKEHAGMTVIQHATIAAKDAYAARGGWMSERQITSITYHENFGQVGRVTVVPEMLA